MDEHIAANRRVWDEWARINQDSALYDMAAFRAGETSLKPIELEEVGPVAGKSLLHLQCHFGQDTLSWARLGARVTGCDLSDKAIDYARQGQIKALQDKDPDVRCTAATVLGKYGPEAKEAVPALTAALKDEDKHVREAVAYALGRIGPDARDAIPSLKETLKDKNAPVRQAAAYALKEIQHPTPKKPADKKKRA